jgi:YidC/Oxa1 family membrane protein insertase
LLIAIVLSALVFLVWQFFFVDKEDVKKSAGKVEQATVKEEPVKAPEPQIKAPESAAPEKTVVSESGTPMPERIHKSITVDTPFFRARLSEQGAGFTSFILKKYREKVAKDSPLQQLLPQKNPVKTVLTGFAGKSLGGLDNAVFSTKLNVDTVSIKDAEQEVTFNWKSDQGVEVEKTYRFSPNSYIIGLSINIINRSGQAIQDKLFVALNGSAPTAGSRYGFEGPSAFIDEKLEEVKIKKIAEKSTYAGHLKWIGVQDRYFLMSVIPENVEEAAMRLSLKGDNLIEAQYLGPDTDIRPGTQHTYNYLIFFGPKSTKILGQVGHDLDKALNFGWFDILAKPCVWLMNMLYGVIPNYGVAIIILTILIKIVLWPLGSKSYKSMSEMKKIQPLMKEIREKYKDDKKKMNEEVMSLYRTYKINPLGGCLPMVVQLPVFFALYRMLYQAIELRHAPFFLWIDDLSAPDRLFHFNVDKIPFMEPPYGIPVLTLIMGATMLLQQKMSPPMGDPTQAKMMMFMPLIFTVIFINFSSGLVLYWLVNNILSILQQYYIQKKFT